MTANPIFARMFADMGALGLLPKSEPHPVTDGMDGCTGCGETLDGVRRCCQPDAEAMHQLGGDAE